MEKEWLRLGFKKSVRPAVALTCLTGALYGSFSVSARVFPTAQDLLIQKGYDAQTADRIVARLTDTQNEIRFRDPATLSGRVHGWFDFLLYYKDIRMSGANPDDAFMHSDRLFSRFFKLNLGTLSENGDTRLSSRAELRGISPHLIERAPLSRETIFLEKLFHEIRHTDSKNMKLGRTPLAESDAVGAATDLAAEILRQPQLKTDALYDSAFAITKEHDLSLALAKYFNHQPAPSLDELKNATAEMVVTMTKAPKNPLPASRRPWAQADYSEGDLYFGDSLETLMRVLQAKNNFSDNGRLRTLLFVGAAKYTMPTFTRRIEDYVHQTPHMLPEYNFRL